MCRHVIGSDLALDWQAMVGQHLYSDWLEYSARVFFRNRSPCDQALFLRVIQAKKVIR